MAPLLYGAATKLATPSEPFWAAKPPGAGNCDVGGQGVGMPCDWQKAFHRLGCSVAMKAVNWYDVPEPSERTTGVTARCGKPTPGLSAAMSAASQNLITPVKISVSVLGESR